MRKIIKTLTLLLFILFLIGCSKTKEFTISFDTNTDYVIESVIIKKGAKLTLPETPEREGFVFDGWYIGDDKFDENTKIEEDLKLTAQWSIKEETNDKDTEKEQQKETDTNTNTNTNTNTSNIKTYKVTFVYYSGINNLVKTVEENKTVAKPADITRTGYLFFGWYIGDEKYDFNQKVNKDITLTSKWTKQSNLDNKKEINIPKIPKITKTDVESISVNAKDVLITKGQTAKIVTNFVPENAANKTLTYTSSSPNIASVDSSGTITGLANKESTATITVKSHNGKTATVNVRVINPVTKVGITSSGYNDAAISQFTGVNKMTFNLYIQTGVDYKSISWTSIGSGGYTLGNDCTSGSHSCTITAKNDGNKNYRLASLTVTVENNLGNKIKASKSIDIEGKFKVVNYHGEFTGVTDLSKSKNEFVTVLQDKPPSVRDFKLVGTNNNLKLEKISEGMHRITCTSTAPTNQTYDVKYQSLTGQTQVVKVRCVK